MSLAILGFSEPVMACEAKSVLFEDHFDQLAPTWGTQDAGYKVEDGRLVLAQDTDQALYAANTAVLQGDIDYCVTVTILKSGDPESAYTGVLFWYVDDGNFYMVQIVPNGTAAIWSRLDGRIKPLIPWKAVQGRKAGDGAANAVEIVTTGNRATVSINGQLLGSVDGVAPPDGQRIGVFAVSSQTGPSKYAFDDIIIARAQ